MSEEKTKHKKVLTPSGRVSFPNVFKAKSNFINQDPKYSVQLLFPKSADLTELKKLVLEVTKKRFGEKADWPANLRLPFKNGDDKNLADYKGMTVIEARSKQKPGLVGKDLQEIIDPADFYPGCWARATLVCYAYPQPGVKGITPGVAFGLQNLQKTKDDVAFSGKSNPSDDFEAIDELESDTKKASIDEDEDELDF